MLIKKVKDHQVVDTLTCGQVRQIVSLDDGQPFGVAILINCIPTKGHYHLTFDETYFVLDGTIWLALYDPQKKEIDKVTLQANELCVISKGVHHKIVSVTPENRLCVLSAPPFHSDDEHDSDILERGDLP